MKATHHTMLRLDNGILNLICRKASRNHYHFVVAQPLVTNKKNGDFDFLGNDKTFLLIQLNFDLMMTLNFVITNFDSLAKNSA